VSSPAGRGISCWLGFEHEFGHRHLPIRNPAGGGVTVFVLAMLDGKLGVVRVAMPVIENAVQEQAPRVGVVHGRHGPGHQQGSQLFVGVVRAPAPGAVRVRAGGGTAGHGADIEDWSMVRDFEIKEEGSAISVLG
jgi:hypothetical protein